MRTIALDHAPEAGVESAGLSDGVTHYRATGDDPRFVLGTWPEGLRGGLYRVWIRTPDEASILGLSVFLAGTGEEGGAPVVLMAAFERSAEGLAASLVLPDRTRSLGFAPVLLSLDLRLGAAEMRRVSSTLNRLDRLQGALRRRLASPQSFGRYATVAWSALRTEGWAGLKRRVRGMVDPAGSAAVQDLDMQFPRFAERISSDNAAVLAGLATAGEGAPTLSVVVPVYKPSEAWFRQLLQTLGAQSDQGFELVLVFDGPQEALRTVAESAMSGRHEPRLVTLPENRGVSAATNAGIRAASGDYVVVVDHDDVLERHLVEAFRYAAAARPADIYFADEAITDGEMSRILTVATRGRFDIRHYLSHPYIVHPIVLRRSLALAVGLLDEALTVSHDVDFFLRCVARAGDVVQVPMVLYYWRTHEGSLGHSRIDAVSASTKAAIRRHLGAETDWPTFEIRDGANFNEYEIRPPVPNEAKAAIVIPTKNRREILAACLSSIEARRGRNAVPADIFVVDHESDPKTIALLREQESLGAISVVPYRGPWNYAAINNAAVAEILTRGAYTHLVFMNNDIEIVTDDWLDRMMAQFSWGDVGVVGCCLQYPDGRVQHGGVVVGLVGPAEHSHKFDPMINAKTGRRYPGHLSSLVATRDYAAVTAALMIVPADLFNAVDGFDEQLAVGFNDTDLCLRIGAKGFRSTYVGSVVATHHESVSRGDATASAHPEDTRLFLARYGDVVRNGDDHYGLLMDWSSSRGRVSARRQKPFALREIRLRERPALTGKDSQPAPATDA